MKRWRVLIQRTIAKQQVKNEQIKRKQTCSVCFVKKIKLQGNKFKIVQKMSRIVKNVLGVRTNIR